MEEVGRFTEEIFEYDYADIWAKQKKSINVRSGYLFIKIFMFILIFVTDYRDETFISPAIFLAVML